MQRKKNVVYIRASTGDQKLTLEFQRCAGTEKARELNLVVHEDDFLVDAGISGFTTTAEQRPDMVKLLKMVANDEVDTVIVYKRDRLIRRAREYMVIAYTLHKYGVKLFFSDSSEPPFTPSYGWFFECMMAALLQKECESIRDKVVLGLKTKHKLGLWVGGSPGYGFRYDKATKKIIVNQVEAGISKDIVVKLAEDQEDPGFIAAYLNNHLKDSSRWTAAKVAKVASNPLLMGISERFGESVKLIDFHPLVSPITWHKAQETLKLKRPPKKVKQTYAKTTLLDGLIYCGFEPKTEFKSKRQGGQEIYYCPVKTTDCTYPKHCFNRSFKKEALEIKVFEFCKNSFSCIKIEPLEQIVQQFLAVKSQEIKIQINSHSKNLQRIRKEKLKKSDQFVLESNLNRREKIDAKVIALNKREIEISDIIAQLESSLKFLTKQRNNHRKISMLIKDWETIFASFELDIQREIYKQILHQVNVFPDRVEIIMNSTEILGLAG